MSKRLNEQDTAAEAAESAQQTGLAAEMAEPQLPGTTAMAQPQLAEKAAEIASPQLTQPAQEAASPQLKELAPDAANLPAGQTPDN